MYPMVVDLDKQDACTEMAQDLLTAQFHQHLNNQTNMRNSRRAYEAQEQARAAKAAERERDILISKKRQSIRSLAVTGAVIGILVYAYITSQVSSPLFIGVGLTASMCFGWCLNSTVRLFRRKHRGTRKG